MLPTDAIANNSLDKFGWQISIALWILCIIFVVALRIFDIKYLL